MSADDQQWTILLCKPSSQQAHHTIVQELQAAGLVIDRKSFNVTPEQALALVLLYPSVKSRISAHVLPKQHATPAPVSTAAAAESESQKDKANELPEFIKDAQRYRRMPNTTTTAASPFLASSQERHRAAHVAAPPDHQLLARIQQLAQGNKFHAATTTTAATAAAGVTTPSRRLSISQQSGESWDDHQRTRGPANASAQRSTGSLHNSDAHTSLRYRRSQLPYHSTTTADVAFSHMVLDTLLDHPALEDPVVRQHVELLVQGGTVLMLLVRGPHAIEQLCALCGPDSVGTARQTAPRSWTARFGFNDVHNAVFTPHTAANAQSAFAAAFAGAGDALEDGGSRERRQQQQFQSTPHHVRSSPTRLPPIPPLPLPPPLLLSDGAMAPAAPLSFAAVLPTLRARVQPHQRLSYYTGVPTSGASSTTVPTGGEAAATATVAGHSATTPVDTPSRRAAQGPSSATAATATLAQSATVRFSPAAPFPERNDRLDEFDNILRERAVGC